MPARGRRPRYCSRSCQARAYRARAAARDRDEHGADAAAGPAEERREPAPAPGAERPRAGGLSRDRIVRAAVRIADSEGLDTMSMRHVAQALGVQVMSLYHHIDGKDELIDLMVEAVFGEGGEADGGGDWRSGLEASARWEWSLYSTHPWVLEVLASVQPPLVPGVLSGVERGLQALDGLGLDTVTAHRVYLSISGLVQGLALLRVSEITAERRDGGASLARWRAVRVPAVLEKLGPDRFPRHAALRDDVDSLTDLEEVFEFSLQRHLDGLALFLEGAGDRARTAAGEEPG
ncbi:TetR/AcrR family transcriptional regulator [Nocardiopsis potens]|uniref:TetR/AcrR family transcriptional regulator n=1 Tax=Nocardiopsis potens TaxID=1246458 RepID=UPI00037DEDC0|nr:TetR/AcrR family transcriptional regulator [Nocardiopsis potens]